jgi:lysozyme family protein
MEISRRTLLSTTAAGLGMLASGQTANAQSIDVDKLPAGLRKQLSTVLRGAEALKIGDTTLARSSVQPARTDLATIVIEALDKTSDPRATSLAKQAADLLSNLSRRGREAFAYPETRSQPPFSSLKADYRQMFETCEIRPEYAREVDQAASFILKPSAVDRYVEVETITNVPWYVIGAIHYREASLNFLGHLHNGDRLDRLTVDVPAGRPKIRPWPPVPWDPRVAWRESAVDALTEFNNVPRWTVEWMLYGFESYNGMGYRSRKIASPYLWSYSQYYDKGGFYSDGKFNPNWKSKQAGLAVIIKALSKKSTDVKVTFEA